MKDINTINLFTVNESNQPVVNPDSVKELIIRIGKRAVITSDQTRVAYTYIIQTAPQSGKTETAYVEELVGDGLTSQEFKRFHGALRTWKSQAWNVDDNRPLNKAERADKKAKAKAKREAEQAVEDAKTGVVRLVGTLKDVVVQAINKLSARDLLDVYEMSMKPALKFYHEEIETIRASRSKVEPIVGETPLTVPPDDMQKRAEKVKLSKKATLPKSAQ